MQIWRKTVIIITEDEVERLEKMIIDFKNNTQMTIDKLKLDNEKLKKENLELNFLKDAKQININRFERILS